MKCLVLYAYPPEPDGCSLQGDMLYKGLLNHKQDATPCHFKESIQKDFYLKHFKPEAAFGIGFWGNVPEIVVEPQKHGVDTVPWFNADGWVANYQEEFDNLDLMFTTSEWVKSIYKRDGVNVSKIIPMHIGIDTDLFKPLNNFNQKSSMRSMLGVKPEEKMILTAGGDVTSKGAQEMFHALAKVNKDFKNWKYVCKSWPSECSSEWREKEEALVKKLGIEDKVIFIEDEFSPEFMVHLLNAADIYAAPSRIEGFGMIQVEAMACGKPVVSINKMGPSETILHNKTGFLAKVAEEIKLSEEWVYPHMGYNSKKLVKFESPKTFAYRADPDDLAKYTSKLLTQDNLREDMGRAARKHAVEKFHYNNISKQMLDITKKKLSLK